MRESQLIDRLEAADPAAKLEPYSEADIQARLPAVRPSDARVRPHRARLAVPALALTALVALALALLPADRRHGLPGPVEALAAQLAKPGGILHTVSDGGLMRIERWQALDRSAWREVTRLEGVFPFETVEVENRDGIAVYSERDDRVTLYPRTDDPPDQRSAGCWTCLVLELDKHVRDGTLRRAGDATIRQRRAIVVEIEPQRAGGEPARLYVAADDGALLRIEMETERGPLREDFLTFEVLEDTAANRRLLEMPAHPGADIVTAGRDTPPPP